MRSSLFEKASTATHKQDKINLMLLCLDFVQKKHPRSIELHAQLPLETSKVETFMTGDDTICRELSECLLSAFASRPYTRRLGERCQKQLQSWLKNEEGSFTLSELWDWIRENLASKNEIEPHQYSVQI